MDRKTSLVKKKTKRSLAVDLIIIYLTGLLASLIVSIITGDKLRSFEAFAFGTGLFALMEVREIKYKNERDS